MSIIANDANLYTIIPLKPTLIMSSLFSYLYMLTFQVVYSFNQLFTSILLVKASYYTESNKSIKIS